MNRRLLISRLLVTAAAAILAVASVALPVRTGGPAVPIAWGCNDPQVGGLAAIFDTCAECEFTGMDGASQGAWTTWHCRTKPDGYYLYVT